MEFFFAILKETGRVLANNLTSPSFLFLYTLVFGLVVLQYRRLQKTSESMLQCGKNIYMRTAVLSTLLGLAGGLTGSLVLIFLGVDLAGIALVQLWLVTFLLMLIKPRFLCFAYAAGVISLASLLIGYPSVNIPQLMGLVGVLHLVESLLIFVSGSISPWPIYVNKNGAMRGGFNLQQFWPIPLVALITVGVIEPRGAILAPDWWPLLRGGTALGQSHTFILIPVMAILGYGEIATTKTPMQAARKSSWHLLLYSTGLIALAVLASRYSLLLPLVALYSPIGHELVIWIGMRSENRPPLFTSPSQGVMILDVVPGTPAHAQGLRCHDIILKTNGESVNTFQEFLDIASQSGETLLLEVTRHRQRFSRHLKVREDEAIGIIPVPDEGTQRYLCMADDGIFAVAARFWHLIRYKLFTP